MLDAGGGGAYAGTNWSSRSMIDMWTALANQETSSHWGLVNGWRKSYELTLLHLSAVKRYKEDLTTAWPPEKSPAAAAYVARLDELIDHLQQTYDAAVANHTAFSGATMALDASRRELAQVVTEYLANSTKLADHEREMTERTRQGRGTVAGTPPPVPDGRQAQLEAQARSIMNGLSTDLIQARAQITKPPIYNAAVNNEERVTYSNGVTYPAPPIPPVIPFDPDAGGTSGGSQSGIAGPPPVSDVPSPQPPNASPTSPRQPGLILGGIETPIVASPSTTHPQPPPLVSPWPGSSPIIGLGPTPPLVVGPLPGSPGTSVPSPVPSHGRAAMWGQPSMGSGQRAMAPGGVIAPAPSTGPGVAPSMGMGAGHHAIGGRAPSSVNPVGGVIGPIGGGARGPAGQPAPGVTHPYAPASRRGNGHPNEEVNEAHWDPDNPWETAQGVSPVVLPVAEQRIDPGPAIGLR